MRSAAIIGLLALGACRPAAPVASSTPVVTPATPVPVVTPLPVPTPAPSACDACFNAGFAMAHDHALSVDIGIRRAGLGGDRRALDYMTLQLRHLGYTVTEQAFTIPSGLTTWNLIAYTGDDPRDTKRYLMLGGHYDTVAVSPGGNDNGTGISSVLELARALTVKPAPLPVVIAMFGAEEVQPGPKGSHHLGSRHYVAGMSAAAKAGLVAYLNLDEVGFGPDLIAGHLKVGPTEGTDRLVRLGRQLGIAVRAQITPEWSDNDSFLKAGMNAGWLWSGNDPFYHTARDTIDHVQTERVEQAGRLMLEAIRSYV